jgi:glycosyltransferase involved in cell wall biosynthesis
MNPTPTNSRPLVMRIITRLAGGGPPVHATLLNRHLEHHGFDSVLVFGNCGPNEKNMEYLLQPGDRFERLPELGASISPFSDLRALFGLWRLMRRYRPEIVHTHTAKAGLLGRLAARLAGCPCVVHTFHGHVLEGYFPPWINRSLRIAEQILARLSSAIFTVSPQQADELARRFEVAPSDKIHVVPLGLDLDPFLAIPDADFNSPVLTITWLGRFVAIKNLPLLLDIAQACQQRRLPLRFAIAGEGPLRADFADSIARLQLNNIELLPWQDNVAPLLSRSHLLLLTSHREGTPLALIQGMAAGRPFLSTPAGGVVDLACGISRNRGQHWLYDNAALFAADPEACVNLLQSLLQDREQLAAMSRQSRRFAAASFSQMRLAADVARLYHQIRNSSLYDTSSQAHNKASTSKHPVNANPTPSMEVNR